MNAPWLGCIADDYTGATDLSAALVRAGLRVVQMFDLPQSPSFPADTDAVVIALKSRSVSADQAVNQSQASLRFLRALGIDRFYFKYCSTFDSRPDGNIGPVAEALADDLQAPEVWYCPSYPENGRTVEGGRLFVNGVPLNECGMQNHPLNPMTDSNLVRVLQAQCRRTVGLKPLAEVRDGRLTARDDSKIRHWIVDAVNDDDLRSIAQHGREHQLLTGGSALAQFWAETLAPDHLASAAGRTQATSPGFPEGRRLRNATVLILAGSCSKATRSQVAAFSEIGPVLHLNVARANDQTIADAANWFHGQSGCRAALIGTGVEPDSVEAARRAWGGDYASAIAESLLAGIARRLASDGVTTMIVAGGETSGAVVQALRVNSVRIGREIAPGVPWVHSLDPPHFALALKSGNFGRPQFFRDALEVCA